MVHVQTSGRQWDILNDPRSTPTESWNALIALLGQISPSEYKKLEKSVKKNHRALLPELRKFPGFEKKDTK